MATAFPAALDAFTNPTGGQVQGATTPTHAGHHANANDAVEAIEAKLGTGASTPSANTVLRGTGAGATAFGQVQAADVAAHAISQMQVVYGTTANPSTSATTSGAAPVLAQMTVTMTTNGGDMLISFSGLFQHASSATIANVELRIDGVVWEARTSYLPTVGQAFLFPLNVGFTGPEIPGGAGSHTFAVYFYGSAATLTSPGIARTLTVCELKR